MFVLEGGGVPTVIFEFARGWGSHFFGNFIMYFKDIGILLGLDPRPTSVDPRMMIYFGEQTNERFQSTACISKEGLDP